MGRGVNRIKIACRNWILLFLKSIVRLFIR
jgi:hypothetical protein